VLVRSDRPLDFELASAALVVTIHLPGAEISNSNNRRPLDTRIFGGPVSRVVPVAVPGGTDLRIELQRRASHSVEQTAGLLTVTFTAE
jgi:hypothetical protein